MSGLILAAPASGSGKTVLTLGLLRHFASRGLRVAAAKAGPDYIDSSFHAAAIGAPCLNLDSWAMRGATVASLVGDLASGAEIVLCEGVMGLFDGAGPAGLGSTADLAALTGWPVVLVVDAGGQAASVAALVRGFAGHRTDVPLAGVILNRVGGERHRELLTAALARHLPDLPLLGAVPRDAELALPARHLGLVPAGEHRALDVFLDRAAAAVAAAIDCDALLALARPSVLARPRDGAMPLPPLGQRIAVAQDAAFCFAYPAVLQGWRRAGAEVAPFSPLADEVPDPDAGAVYLPGGYPELHAGALAASRRYGKGLRDAAARGAFVYGECGGYMALGDGLVDAAGETHAMAGLLPLVTSFAMRRLHLGYRAIRLVGDSPLGAAGSTYRGHEFHYASIVEEGAGERFAELADAEGRPLGAVGLRRGRTMGSFVHLIDRELLHGDFRP
ncbi:MAG: cobB [Rhodospirillales bacterium]|nr:cobB [Rhodospirillales bacterium]